MSISCAQTTNKLHSKDDKQLQAQNRMWTVTTRNSGRRRRPADQEKQPEKEAIEVRKTKETETDGLEQTKSNGTNEPVKDDGEGSNGASLDSESIKVEEDDTFEDVKCKEEVSYTNGVEDGPVSPASRSADYPADEEGSPSDEKNVRPGNDAKLSEDLNGQEPTLQNLIMAAIGVMKNRKARPDAKRICNWIHRRYGNEVVAVSDELERLVGVGELARVDYKGSASFRIVNPSGKIKRKKMTIQPLETPSATQDLAGGLSPMVRNQDALLPRPFYQVTLRTLVLDLLAESGVTIIEPTTTISTKFISTAVERTMRTIEKSVILKNLDLLLSQEVDCGNFSKVGDDLYHLPPNGTPYQPPTHSPPHSGMTQIQPIPNGKTLPLHSMIVPTSSLNVPPTSLASGSLQQQSFSFSASPPTAATQHPQGQGLSSTVYDQVPVGGGPGSATPPPLTVRSPVVNSSAVSMPPPPTRTPGLPPMTSLTPPPASTTYHKELLTPPPPNPSNTTLTITGIKTDEERKDDLIKEKLFKLTSSMSGSKGKGSSGKHHGKFVSQPEQVHLTLKENHLKAEKTRKSKSVDGQKRRDSSGYDRPDVKLEPMDPQQEAENRGLKRRRSQHPTDEKGADALESEISRKIFDPADHDQPSKKRRVPSPLLLNDGIKTGTEPAFEPSPSTAASSSSSSNHHLPIKIEVGCRICHRAVSPSLRRGKSDVFLKCVDCSARVHANCMDYTDELAKKIMALPWQCPSCKTCHVCSQDTDSGNMLICDSCDLGFHMGCHKPSLFKKPSGSWECFKCSPQPPPPPPPVPQVAKSRNPSREPTNPIRVTHPSGQEKITNGFHFKQEKPSVSSKTVLDDESRFIPILPPHYSPHTGVLPENWSDYEPDPEVPNVSGWDASKVKEYFFGLGFPEDICQIFAEQEIDGGSLLLLHRNDVLTSLGLKLGPALKVFSHVKKLQTRRRLPNF